MNKFLLIALAAAGLTMVAYTTRAQDMKGEHDMAGILIDNQCGAKQADEAAAAKHTVACCKKEACAASGYQLIVGDKHYKLDDKGIEQAKAYLAKADSTKVIVTGKMEGDDKIAVTAIKAAGEKKAN
jgi:hypothetical protein